MNGKRFGFSIKTKFWDYTDVRDSMHLHNSLRRISVVDMEGAELTRICE